MQKSRRVDEVALSLLFFFSLSVLLPFFVFQGMGGGYNII